jgi:uncharacterized protein
VAHRLSEADDLGMTNTDQALQVLLANQCWELLRANEVGRLAISVGGQPDIFPVNYVVDHGTIVFRTAEGTKLAAVVSRSQVAFEVDGEQVGVAWSVVVKGRAVEIADRYELFDALDLPLYPWNASPRHHFVRIVPEQVTGRRFVVVDRAAEHVGDPVPHRSGPD